MKNMSDRAKIFLVRTSFRVKRKTDLDGGRFRYWLLSDNTQMGRATILCHWIIAAKYFEVFRTTCAIQNTKSGLFELLCPY
jgi:hypothetical protein